MRLLGERDELVDERDREGVVVRVRLELEVRELGLREEEDRLDDDERLDDDRLDDDDRLEVDRDEVFRVDFSARATPLSGASTAAQLRTSSASTDSMKLALFPAPERAVPISSASSTR